MVELLYSNFCTLVATLFQMVIKKLKKNHIMLISKKNCCSLVGKKKKFKQWPMTTFENIKNHMNW